MRKTNEKGITLIALIITIIVMLILVVITVNFALGDEGILTNAKTASAETEKKAILEELISMAEFNDKGEIDVENLRSAAERKYEDNVILGDEKLTITGKTGTYFYKVTETEIKIMELSLLEKYILGENGKGRALTEIISNLDEIYNVQDMMFIDETSTIPNAKTDVKAITSANETLYLEYEDKVYRVKNDMVTTKTCELVYKQTGREGDDLGEVTGNPNYYGWIIIYDNGTSVEAVSPEAMKKAGDTDGLTLGYDDSTIDWTESEIIAEANIDGEEELTDIEKAIYSYNNAIETINTYCRELPNLPKNYRVRSVGAKSDPTSENNTYNGIPEEWPNNAATKYNGKGKAADTAFEQDLVRMTYLEKVNINVNEYYWMASRNIVGDSSARCFDVWTVFDNGFFISSNLWGMHYADYSCNSYSNSAACAVRPIITVKI